MMETGVGLGVGLAPVDRNGRGAEMHIDIGILVTGCHIGLDGW